MKAKRAFLATLALTLVLGSVLCVAGTTHRLPADAPLSPFSDSSVVAFPLGLYGSITSNVLVDRLADGAEESIFIGTSNGLYVLEADGQSSRLIYSPFEVTRVMLIDDVTGDGLKEIVFIVNSSVVPCLRCHDGATLRLLWESSARQRLFLNESGWTQAQIRVSDLEVLYAGPSQRIVLASYRTAYCFDAEAGNLIWTFTGEHSLDQVAIIGPDDASQSDRILVSSIDGALYLLDASGRMKWQQRLPRSRRIWGEASEFQSSADQLATVDKAKGMVAIATTDGWLRLLNLNHKVYEWEMRHSELPEQSLDYITIGKDRVCIAYADLNYSQKLFPVADINGDGISEILFRKPASGYYPPYYYPGSSDPSNTGNVTLVDSTGRQLWEREFKVPATGGIEWEMRDIRPVVLDVNGDVLETVDLVTGQLIESVPLASLAPSSAEIEVLSDQRYLVYDRYSSDIRAILESGEEWWHYPRISRIGRMTGDFNGDGVADNLFLCEALPGGGGSPYPYEYSPYPPEAVVPGVRLLVARNGQSQDLLWSYESPVTGVMYNVQIIEDIVGQDGIADIMAHSGNSVLIFSGADGSIAEFEVDSPIESVGPLFANGLMCGVVVGFQTGPATFDLQGDLLWNDCYLDMGRQNPTRIVSLDDINRDGVSDLGLISVDNITILGSLAGQPHYSNHLSFMPPEGTYFDYSGITPDIDGDGLRDICYVERQQQPDYTKAPLAPLPPVMVIRSVADEKILLEVERGMTAAWSPACGDFNGDGCMDSIVTWCPQQYGYVDPLSSEDEMEILSGKDGTSLCQRSLGAFCSYGQVHMSSIGDVNGDGSDEVMYIEDFDGYPERRISIIVYDVRHASIVKQTPCGPIIAKPSASGSLYEKWNRILADMNGDGLPELAVWLDEGPADNSIGPGYGSGGECLALVDTMQGDVLGTLWPLSRHEISLFETGQPYVVGVAARGSLLLVDMASDLQITSPASGSATGSRVHVTWQPDRSGYLKGVYADGRLASVTDEAAVTILVEPGKQQLLVKLMDRNGRVSYGTAEIHASGSPVEILFMVALGLLLFVVVLCFAYPRTARLLVTRRRRRMNQTSHEARSKTT